MAKGISIDVDIDHWIDGAARFRTEWVRKTEPEVRRVMERAFRIADQKVHVISGQLKASGEFDVETDGDEVRGVLSYSAPYALYEFGRGGEHDALTPAIVEVGDEYLDAMMTGAERAVDTWR